MNQSDNKTWGGRQNWEQPMNLSASCKNKPAKESPLAPKLWSPGPITALLPRRYRYRTTHNLTQEKPEEGNEQNTYARAINAMLNPQGLKTGYFACIHAWRCYSKVDVKSQREWESPTRGRAGDSLVKTGGSLECSKSCTLAPSSHSRWIFWLRLICNFPHSYFTKGREKRNHLDLVSLERGWESILSAVWDLISHRRHLAPHLPVHAFVAFLWLQSSFRTFRLTLNSTKELDWVQKWSSGKLRKIIRVS